MKFARTLTRIAILTTLSIVLGKILSLTIGPIRISLENLPVVFAGIIMGPLCGMVVGLVADVLGSLLVGYAINPIITLGAASIGLTAGIVYRLRLLPERYNLLVSVFTAHLIGSIIIKTAGLVFLYGHPWAILAYRIPLYLAIAATESCLIAYLSGRLK